MVKANGEVQTSEEAQVFVHDLDRIVTVQLLEDTPAVLSLGKLCEEHGYSCEWARGQKPQLAKSEKRILCKTENFVPVVVLGLSSSSGKSSSSTSFTHLALHRVQQDYEVMVLTLKHRETEAILPKSKTKIKKGGNNQAKRLRLRDLPEWLPEFTDNLEDAEVPAPAHMSHDSDSERPTKVVRP